MYISGWEFEKQQIINQDSKLSEGVAKLARKPRTWEKDKDEEKLRNFCNAYHWLFMVKLIVQAIYSAKYNTKQ